MATTETAPTTLSAPAAAGRVDQTPSLWARLVRWLFQPVDLGLIVFFRVAFGVIMMWEVWRYFSYGWIARYFVEPTFHFTFYGFDWVRPWPGNGMYWHFGAMGLLAGCIALGLFYRVATTLFFLAFTYVFLLDQAKYLNHFYLICWVSLLMVFIPAHRAFSLDALRKPSLYSTTAPRWTLWLLRTQLGIAYFYGGLAKINSDWLAGEPMRMFLNSRFGYTPDGRFQPVPEAAVWFFTWGGLLFDLLIVPALMWHRTRVAAFCVAVLFHFMNDNLFSIGIFPWFMIAGTLIFCPPEWLQIGEPEHTSPKRKRGMDQSRLSSDSRMSLNWSQKLTLGLLGSYAAFQFLFPLRHYLYPGPVSWTEEGHHFAWHMKLRAKDGVAEFRAFDAGGREIPVPPVSDLLSPRQADSMPGKPFMILQYAHHLAGVLRSQGHEPAAIRVTAYASLNGREPQLLVDPDVNLLEKNRSIWPADWLVPLTTELPARGSVAVMERRMRERAARQTGGASPYYVPPSGMPLPNREAPRSAESVE